jgi:hypothetical protein
VNAADRVADLQRRVAELENRVAAIEREKASSIGPSAAINRGPKDDWQPFEFNGQTIYIVPTSNTLHIESAPGVDAPTIMPFFPDQHIGETLLKYEPLPPPVRAK